jgi:predicted DNA-binding mobile mystery protein A
MSIAQLAKRLDVPRQNIHRIEQSETAGHVTVATLKKIADQLSCDLYVTFIPKTSLQILVKKRADEAAKKILDRTQLHMGLEDQKASEDFVKAKASELADQLIQTSDKRLWEDL